MLTGSHTGLLFLVRPNSWNRTRSDAWERQLFVRRVSKFEKLQQGIHLMSLRAEIQFKSQYHIIDRSLLVVDVLESTYRACQHFPDDPEVYVPQWWSSHLLVDCKKKSSRRSRGCRHWPSKLATFLNYLISGDSRVIQHFFENVIWNRSSRIVLTKSTPRLS